MFESRVKNSDYDILFLQRMLDKKVFRILPKGGSFFLLWLSPRGSRERSTSRARRQRAARSTNFAVTQYESMPATTATTPATAATAATWGFHAQDSAQGQERIGHVRDREGLVPRGVQ